MKVWDLAKPVVEEWTGMELKPSSQYGIRIYTEGMLMLLLFIFLITVIYSSSSDNLCFQRVYFAIDLGAILNPHADRLPLVSSCIINVAQDVDEE